MSYDVGMSSLGQRPARSWVSWGAVFAGALIGAAVMTLLGLLWLAIAAGGPNLVSNNLDWFMGGTGILATFLAGLFAGWFASGRDLVFGVAQGLTEWGLLTFVVVIVGPGLATIFRSLVAAGAVTGRPGWLWASFWSVLIGLAAALIGSAIGGMIDAPWAPHRGRAYAPGDGEALAEAGSEPARSDDAYRRRP